MKKPLAALAFVLMLTVAHALRAQVPDASSIPPPAQVVSLLTLRLALTDDQKAQLLPIIEGRQQKVKAILADTSLRLLQKKRAAEKVRDESDQRIKMILTPGQWKQYAAVEEQMQQQMRGRMQSAN